MTKRNMTAKITKPVVTPVPAVKAKLRSAGEIAQPRPRIYGFAMISK